MSVPHTRQGPLPEPKDLVAAWRAGGSAARAALVSDHAPAIDEAYAQKLKALADHALRNDLRECLDIADLLLALGEATGIGPIRALGLLVRANGIGIGHGDYAAAIPDYETAANIYLELDRPVDAARSRIGQVVALATQQAYDRALTVGEAAADVFRKAERFDLLSGLLSNIGLIYGRAGQDKRALVCFDEVMEICQSTPTLRRQLAQTGINRSIVLRNLGRFPEAIAAAEASLAIATDLNMLVDVANAYECLAITYSLLGRYNDALLLFEKTLDILTQGERRRDAATVELSVSACLLNLGRLVDGLDHARRAREAFDRLGGRIELGQARLFEAQILDNLGHTAEAEEAIAVAQTAFEAENNSAWLAQAAMARASLVGRHGDTDESLALALGAAETFTQLGQLQNAALARLLAARSALRLGQSSSARELAKAALETGQALGASDLVHPALQILGEIERQEGRLEAALATFEKSMAELERVRSQMMIEDRSFFLRNKLSIYEEAVDASLEGGQPARGLGYAERAKSRALLDMLDQRVSVRLEAHTPEDRPIVDELLALRAQRDEIVRRWQGEHASLLRDGAAEAPEQIRLELARIEKRLTTLWHQLLMRNARYARAADLWQVQNDDVLSALPAGATLLEYFVVHGELVAFVGRSARVTAHRLGVTVEQIARLARPWLLNLASCQDAAARGIAPAASLIASAQVVLKRLHDALLGPMAGELVAGGDADLIVVPHGPLHYLPFAALYDGRTYLAERHALRLLPSSGLLRHVGPAALDPNGGRASADEFLAVGYSSNNQLPAARSEATAIARLMAGTALVEEAATAAALSARAPQLRAMHLATHAEFRADNPLFSGLALADGWLTTLDLFNWRLNASLVTLSACQTGRSVIGGGDEILGLLRALLYAGARSVVASLWPVQDTATAALMERFYGALAAGQPKALALRNAQLDLRNEGFGHPYFWAPFFLVGDSGTL